MSIETEVFKRKTIDFKKLVPFGFKKVNNTYKYSKNFLEENFRTDIVIDKEGKITGKVYDLLVDDEYTNFRVENQEGEFVNKIRNEYISILNEIAEKCCIGNYFISAQANRISNLIYEKYKDVPEFPWDKDESSGVFRNPDNKKWYGLIMCIDKSRLSKNASDNKSVSKATNKDKASCKATNENKASCKATNENKTSCKATNENKTSCKATNENKASCKTNNEDKVSNKIANKDRLEEQEEIEVLNVKLNPDKILKLKNKKGYYECYHMNKKYWITIALDDTLKDEEIMQNIIESHSYTEKSNEWIIPSNPKFFDVVGHFENNKITTWKQSSDIKVGDIIYMYVGTPYSAILYKCEAIEVNIPYKFKDKNLTMSRIMKLKLLEKYDKNKYTFEFLKENNVRAVRGPRFMPEALSKKINGSKSIKSKKSK